MGCIHWRSRTNTISDITRGTERHSNLKIDANYPHLLAKWSRLIYRVQWLGWVWTASTIDEVIHFFLTGFRWKEIYRKRSIISCWRIRRLKRRRRRDIRENLNFSKRIESCTEWCPVLKQKPSTSKSTRCLGTLTVTLCATASDTTELPAGFRAT